MKTYARKIYLGLKRGYSWSLVIQLAIIVLLVILTLGKGFSAIKQLVESLQLEKEELFVGRLVLRKLLPVLSPVLKLLLYILAASVLLMPAISAVVLIVPLIDGSVAKKRGLVFPKIATVYTCALTMAMCAIGFADGGVSYSMPNYTGMVYATILLHIILFVLLSSTGKKSRNVQNELLNAVTYR